MVSIIKKAASAIGAVEDSVIGLSTAANNFARSLIQHNRFCIAESSLELSGGVTAYTYYAGKFFDVLPIIAHLFTDQIPYFIALCTSTALKHFLGGTGIILNVFRGAKESLSLYRQCKFLSLFEKHAWKGTRNDLAKTIENFDKPGFQESLPLKFRKIITDKKQQLEKLLTKIDSGDQKAVEKIERVFALLRGRKIHDKLAKITNLPDVELERALPVWLNTDVVNQGGKIYLKNLLGKVDKGDPKAVVEATKLLDTMQSYAIEKSCVHILKITGAIIGALSCIGFFIAAPWAFTLMVLAFIGIFSAAAYMYNSGVVENRDGGFSLKLCVPEFIRNLAFDISKSPDKIRAWINSKKPKVLTPHPFFEKRTEIARKTVHVIQRSAEHLERRTRRATQALLRAS